MDNIRRWIVGGVAVAVVVFALVSIGSLIEYLPASGIMVIQAPFSGHLSVYTQPGVYWQGYGTVTHYPKREQFWFSAKSDQGQKANESITIRFNDGGHAQLSGSIAWEMPVSAERVIMLHTKYGSPHAIQQQLVRTVIEKVVYMTGPLMSSAQSYAERRNDLLSLIEDQVVNGVYMTDARDERIKDPMTGIDKTVRVVSLVKAATGGYARQESSPVTDFGIRTFNLSINQIEYDKTVEAQIQQQQQAVMQVQTAVARAKEAEQEAITVGKRGEAEAAKAKWEQEVVKAREVTAAEQRKRVAELDAQAAEMTKRQQILLGEGEAQRRQLVMTADGALDKKLDAWLKSQQYWADAFSKFQGKVVPDIVSGPGAAGVGSSNAAVNFMELMGMKAAKDLAVDLQAQGGKRTQHRE